MVTNVSRPWMVNYKLNKPQQSALRDSAMKAEQMFRKFNWGWANTDMPTALQIEEQLTDMVNQLLKRQGFLGDADSIMTGRLMVGLTHIDDEFKHVGFYYGLEIDEDFEAAEEEEKHLLNKS